MRNGKIIIFSAPSGAGKTSIVHRLLQAMPDSLGFSISCTTRTPRQNEIDGKDYYFLSLELFQNKISQGDFAEWEEVYPGRFYGTLKSEIERLWLQDRHVVFDIDVQGGLNLKNLYPTQSLAIFVQPPSLKELARRLHIRSSEAYEDFQVRLQKAESEITYAKVFDKVLINDDLLEVLSRAKELVENFIT
ncbi:guanylate kinase [Bacteroidetes bacterium endosymbiont of Geopemphigus sp.]|uniref:guanylate kinase n=1 Tax=Bacteroidetes bacterium endosymbiont of Geopemphigus sp. TaxID=2047937 RepID=UPI000CD0D2B7|nr:guanylate kinase [Bacteroidetes bacterium endosymbiont of Geopemphigus sp.]